MKHYIATNRVIRKVREKEIIAKSGYFPPSQNIRFATIEDDGEDIEVYPDIELESREVDYSVNNNDQKGSAILLKELFSFLGDENNELIIFIHGYGNDTKNIRKFTEKLHEHYVKDQNENRRLLTFFWTTNGHKLSPIDYKLDANDSIIAGQAFAKLLERWDSFLQFKGYPVLKGKIHLMAQSMGNQVLKHALNHIHNTLELTIKFQFSEILLIAADIEKQAFKDGEAFDRLPLLANRIHIFGQKKDFALKLSNAVWAVLDKDLRIRLGQGFGKSEIAPNWNNVYAVDVDIYTREDTTINVDEIVEHWYFLTSKGVINQINNVLDGLNCDQYKT